MNLLACCEPNFEYLAGRAASVFMLGCIVVGVAVVAYLVLRDVFRLAREGIPLRWLAAIGAVLTGAGCLAAGALGMIVAPCLVGAYLIGRGSATQMNSQDRND
jgi:hypothetical protein